MKVNSLIRYKFTADYYDFILQPSTDGTGNTNEYFFAETVKCNAYVDNTGRLFLHVAEPLRIGGRVTNIRGVDGTLMVGSQTGDVGYGYEITSVEPVMNVFGYRDALRYTLVRL